MACLALFPNWPSRVCVRFHSPRYVSFCQCRHQLLGPALSFSRWNVFRSSRSHRTASFICSEWSTQREENPVSRFVSSKPSRLRKFIPASNSVGGAISSPNDVGFDIECRPGLKPVKNYAVREAKLDEELWAAAWIRAQSYCEEQPYVRHLGRVTFEISPEDEVDAIREPYIESYKKKFAEQEFDALKRRLLGKYGQSIRCICLVAVSGQSSQDSTMNGTQNGTILERVVGTLDLSIRQLSQGEAFPGDSIRATLSMGAPDFQGSHQYGYIANVCVTKAARQTGIGSSLLGTAIKAGKDWGELHRHVQGCNMEESDDGAKSYVGQSISVGLKELFVHVNSTNKAAQCLYTKFKFQKMQAGAVELGVQNIVLLQLLL